MLLHFLSTKMYLKIILVVSLWLKTYILKTCKSLLLHSDWHRLSCGTLNPIQSLWNCCCVWLQEWVAQVLQSLFWIFIVHFHLNFWCSFLVYHISTWDIFIQISLYILLQFRYTSGEVPQFLITEHIFIFLQLLKGAYAGTEFWACHFLYAALWWLLIFLYIPFFFYISIRSSN